MGLLGAMSYLFIVGKIHRVELKVDEDESLENSVKM
jgi:ACS family glucarate transporter-like MFS transporter